MKELLLVRHAKSDWDKPHLSDHERPLNKRGHRAATAMGVLWAGILRPPDLFVSSSARRALDTAHYFARAWRIPAADIRQDDHLYLATPHRWLHIVRMLPDSAALVAMFGHNEGISEFVAFLLGRTFVSMPTCAGVWLQMAIDAWADVSEDLATLQRYEFPKKYGL